MMAAVPLALRLVLTALFFAEETIRENPWTAVYLPTPDLETADIAVLRKGLHAADWPMPTASPSRSPVGRRSRRSRPIRGTRSPAKTPPPALFMLRLLRETVPARIDGF